MARAVLDASAPSRADHAARSYQPIPSRDVSSGSKIGADVSVHPTE